MKSELLKVGDIVTPINLRIDARFDGRVGLLLSVTCSKVVSALELRRARATTKHFYGCTTLCDFYDESFYVSRWRLDMLKLYVE